MGTGGGPGGGAGGGVGLGVGAGGGGAGRVAAGFAAGRLARAFLAPAFLAAGLFVVAFFLVAGFRRAAGFFLAAGFRRAAALFAVVFRAAVFFLAAGFLRAAGFRRAAVFFAVVFLRAAGFRRAAVFFAVVFLRAAAFPGDRFAVAFFLRVAPRWAMGALLPLSPSLLVASRRMNKTIVTRPQEGDDNALVRRGSHQPVRPAHPRHRRADPSYDRDLSAGGRDVPALAAGGEPALETAQRDHHAVWMVVGTRLRAGFVAVLEHSHPLVLEDEPVLVGIGVGRIRHAALLPRAGRIIPRSAWAVHDARLELLQATCSSTYSGATVAHGPREPDSSYRPKTLRRRRRLTRGAPRRRLGHAPLRPPCGRRVSQPGIRLPSAVTRLRRVWEEDEARYGSFHGAFQCGGIASQQIQVNVPLAAGPAPDAPGAPGEGGPALGTKPREGGSRTPEGMSGGKWTGLSR
jgi:hypothetical protein